MTLKQILIISYRISKPWEFCFNFYHLPKLFRNWFHVKIFKTIVWSCCNFTKKIVHVIFIFYFLATMALVDTTTWVNNNINRTPIVTQATDSPSHREDLRGQVQVKVKYLYAHNQGLFRVWLSNLLRFHEKNVNVIFIYFHSSIISYKNQ